MSFYAQVYKHKPESQVAAMTPAERVDEWLKERGKHLSDAHTWDPSDKQEELLRKYIYADGIKAASRLTQIFDQFEAKKVKKGLTEMDRRLIDAVDLLRFLDSFSVRLRSGEDGRNAIKALDNAVQRMRTAGYDITGENAVYEERLQREHCLKMAVVELSRASGVNSKDLAIQDTLRLSFDIILSDAELILFSHYLTKHHPDYPGWSTDKLTRDESRLGPGGYPIQVIVLEQPERYRAAYLEFRNRE